MPLETYGKYQLLKRLATGGMAEIFLAKRLGGSPGAGPTDADLLVIKRILPHLTENDEFVRMFLAEAKIAARLNHPNIVQIFDLGAQEDTYFIAMEYIHGEDVRRVWKRAESQGRPMSLPLVCKIVSEAARGLHYAHRKTDASGTPLGIVHRDVSPQNLLVTFKGGVKIVDFGIAKAADQSSNTRSGVLKGKYSYMSPEQAQGKRVDHRTDIFALGIVLFELATGTRLFKRANEMLTLNAVIQCEVPKPSEVNPELPRDLDPIVLKALARDPADRYQRAEELHRALEEWLASKRLSDITGSLAAFMQEIYAERLVQEEGQLPLGPDELEAQESAGRSADRPDSIDPRSAPPTAVRPELAAQEEAAPTRQERAEGRRRKVPPSWEPALDALTRVRTSVRASLATLPLVRTVPLWAWAALVVFVATGSTALFLLPKPQPRGPARVYVTSDPPGAQVRIEGQPALRTPGYLPVLAPGSYRLQLTAPGYRSVEGRVRIPASGEIRLETVRLERLAPPRPEVPAALRSTPQTVSTPAQGPARAPAGEGARHHRGTGYVRFVINPVGSWAEVTCGRRKLGTTPMKDQPLPAGRYECRFINPQQGSRTRRFLVHPEQTTKVTVSF